MTEFIYGPFFLSLLYPSSQADFSKFINILNEGVLVITTDVVEPFVALNILELLVVVD